MVCFYVLLYGLQNYEKKGDVKELITLLIGNLLHRLD